MHIYISHNRRDTHTHTHIHTLINRLSEQRVKWHDINLLQKPSEKKGKKKKKKPSENWESDQFGFWSAKFGVFNCFFTDSWNARGTVLHLLKSFHNSVSDVLDEVQFIHQQSLVRPRCFWTWTESGNAGPHAPNQHKHTGCVCVHAAAWKGLRS